MQTAFFMGPILAPLLGRGLIGLGSWRFIMAFGVVIAAITLGWSHRLDETLPPERRQPLGFARTTEAFRIVITHRVTLGYALVVMFDFSAFYPFLASTELIFDDVFDRAGLFVPFMTVSSSIFAVTAIVVARVIPRRGAVSVARFAAAGLVTFSALMYVVTRAADGIPNLWVWLAILTAANCCHTAILPTCRSLALVPMGARAGTAAAVVGLLGGAGGAFLATFTNRAIAGTVTPLVVGYLAFSSLALLTLWLGQHRPPRRDHLTGDGRCCRDQEVRRRPLLTGSRGQATVAVVAVARSGDGRGQGLEQGRVRCSPVGPQPRCRRRRRRTPRPDRPARSGRCRAPAPDAPSD